MPIKNHLKGSSWRDQDLGGSRPNKSVCVTRYGAIGDAIQTSSVLAELKRKYKYVCINCEEKTYNILKHDPSIDEFFIQAKNQVPKEELAEYWNKLAPLFTKYINLCECVEGSCLAIPSRIQHSWPKEVRHKLMNHNYIELMHGIAEVPYTKPNTKFYPSKKEMKWAEKERKKLKGEVILWALSGSSIHKFTPHTDTVVQNLLNTHKNLYIVFVGDNACRILESGWEDNSRVLCRSGEWNIRQVLTFAELCNVIVGPETGVLNSVSMSPMRKIVLLSHSTKENLSRDWVNTSSLAPENVGCYPCHMLHYSSKYCDIHQETGSAMCAYNISPETIYHEITKYL